MGKHQMFQHVIQWSSVIVRGLHELLTKTHIIQRGTRSVQ